MYIDDEPDLCEIFSELFSSEDVEIVTFVDSQMAVMAATRDPPDVIFVDYRFPERTGDQVAHELPRDVPKYLVSGDLSLETSYPFVAIFEKPFNASAILAVLATVAKQKQ